MPIRRVVIHGTHGFTVIAPPVRQVFNEMGHGPAEVVVDVQEGQRDAFRCVRVSLHVGQYESLQARCKAAYVIIEERVTKGGKPADCSQQIFIGRALRCRHCQYGTSPEV